MKRFLLFAAALTIMASVSAVALQKNAPLLLISWAKNAQAENTPVAILIELGVKDEKGRDWSGRAKVTGAKVVNREGYRFRTGDKLLKGTAWEASSRRAIRAPKGQPGITKLEPIASVGVVLHLAEVKDDATLTVEQKDLEGAASVVPLKEVLTGKVHSLWNGTALVRLISTAVPVETAKTEDDFPAAAYGPDGTLWVAYISYTVKEDRRRIEAPMLRKQPEDFKAYYTPDFGDQLLVKYYRGGVWSEPIPITQPGQDLARCAVVSGKIFTWAIYSAQRNGNFDIYARVVAVFPNDGKQTWRIEMGREQRLTTQPGPDINPVACTDQEGTPWLACQSWGEDGQGRISVFKLNKQGNFNKLAVIEGKKGENCWHPAIAADNTGKVAVAYDIYRDGDYDVLVNIFDIKTGKDKSFPVAATPKSETRPSVAYQNNRLWVACEEGPEMWGKDYGAQSIQPGYPLYNERSVRVVRLHPDGTVTRPFEKLPTSSYDPPRIPFDAFKTSKYERTTRYAYPKLGIDLNGHLWLGYRQNFGSRYSSHPGSYWLTFVRRLEEKSWSPPIEVQHSDGLLDHRPVLLPHKSGGLLVIHNTDGRYTTPEVIDNQIYASVINLPPDAGTPKEVAHAVREKPWNDIAAAERAAVERIRKHRIAAGGKTYQILRGEFHRHTEISWDGGADGSLEDMFRYAIDAAAMDWIGNGDHDNGAGSEYSWWLIQKFTDAFHTANAFTPMFTYERSVSYPHGHRNCMFAKRGVRTLPRLAPPKGKKKSPGGVHPDDTKMLYRYLKELDGICAVHTSATGMGTDWRDNDAAVEPIVEIYQGDRMSYEMEGAPRAGFDPQTKKLPANVAGWYPKGFVNNALDKGYRLGFQASSDHWSTHISYFMVLAEKHDRKAILGAIKKRHTYGATDNIIVDVRSGPHIMGDDFKTGEAPTLEIRVSGASDLAKIDIIRDSKVLVTLKPQGQGYKTTWTDPQPSPGTHSYYIRVLQRNNEIAWSSPMWINYVK
jgi:hypothetical protein